MPGEKWISFGIVLIVSDVTEKNADAIIAANSRPSRDNPTEAVAVPMQSELMGTHLVKQVGSPKARLTDSVKPNHSKAAMEERFRVPLFFEVVTSCPQTNKRRLIDAVMHAASDPRGPIGHVVHRIADLLANSPFSIVNG